MLSNCGTERRVSRRRSMLAIVAGVLALTVLTAAPAAAEDETHCVLDVLDVLLDGEFIMSEPVCFATFDEAMNFIGAGDIGIESGRQLFAEKPALNSGFSRTAAADPDMSKTNGSSFIIGIHFKGSGGTGSSVSITGSSCSGGYWNASSSWRNVITSSYNGCGRLAHYSQLNISGSRYDTVTVGQTDTIYGSMDNNTESVRYLSG